MSKEMLINVAEGHECRIAVLNDGVLQELYIERSSAESHVGNVYKGRVTNVEPGIQAAFVDYGAAKNGFLHISDVQPQYFPSHRRSGTEVVGKKRSRHDRPPIQECLRRGQEVIVQVTKEGIGTKGSTLTTYLSIPGRFLVMMPGMSRLGVSRKIEDDQERHKLRSVLEELPLPDNMGFIIRTAGMDRAKRDLQNDLNYLLRLWRAVEKKQKSAKAPAVLYQESDLVIRTIRDIYSSEIAQIICDSERVARKVVEFLSVVMPRGKHAVKLYEGQIPLFHRYDLEREIEKIYARRVELPGGGSLVIDQTEAMVAIDVNSGRFREASNAEDTAFRTNVTAAKEISRQLRLRDMGGVIVIDFIDMREEKHRREVERTLREAIKTDRARTKVLKISRFGIVEMTRQRVRPSLKHSMYRECPYCKAAGLIKSDESLALDVMRNLQLASTNDGIAAIEVTVAPGVAEFVNNRRRRQIAQIELDTRKSITVHGDALLGGDEVRFHCTDPRGSVVAWTPAGAALGGAAIETFREIHSEDMGEAESELTELPEAPVTPGTDEEPERRTERREGGRLERYEEDEWFEPAEMAEEFARAEPARPRPAAPAPAGDDAAVAGPEAAAPPVGATEGDGQPAKKRRRRRGGRKHRRRHGTAQEAEKTGAPAETPASPDTAVVEAEMEAAVQQSINAIEAVEEPAEAPAVEQRRGPVSARAPVMLEPPAEPRAEEQPLLEAGRTNVVAGERQAGQPEPAAAAAEEPTAEPAKKQPARRRAPRRRTTKKGVKKKAAKGVSAQSDAEIQPGADAGDASAEVPPPPMAG